MKLYQQRLTSGQVQLMPGAIDLLRFLQDHDKQSFITSSSGKETIIQTAQVTGLTQYFTGFVSGDEVTKNKPAPDIYLHALSKAQKKSRLWYLKMRQQGPLQEQKLVLMMLLPYQV